MRILIAALVAFFIHSASQSLWAANGSASPLSGQVKSDEEGPMEGVLVSAKRAGSTVTITVVSDQEGRFAFPSAKLEPGQYSLAIRAVGYDLDQPTSVTVAPDGANRVDLKLRKAKDLSLQLSNAEWIASAPGTDQQKLALLNCMGCHTVERIFKSKYNAEEFAELLPRMANYANQSMPSHPQVRMADRLLEERGDQRAQQQRKVAEFLSTINLSSSPQRAYPLKTFDRPKGRATHVVITEYDLPRETLEPHDVIVDAKGMVWFSNFGEQTLGKLDPATAKITEFTLPELKHDFPIGTLGLRTDPNGNMWIGMMYQGGFAKFDPSAEKFQTWSLPKDVNIDAAQVNMVSPEHSAVDGKVWLQNNGFAGIHRLELTSGKIETFEPFRDGVKGQAHNIYDIIPDSQNNAYFTDFRQAHIGRIDAKSGKVTLYQTPTPNSAPRRGMMDAQDRLWFAEYRGNRVAMFDTKTEQFKEWTPPTPWTAPYDVTIDKNGEVWSGSMVNDRVLRLDPASGQMTEYLLPKETNMRRVFVDNSTSPVTFWVGSNHGAAIVKVEPLD